MFSSGSEMEYEPPWIEYTRVIDSPQLSARKHAVTKNVFDSQNFFVWRFQKACPEKNVLRTKTNGYYILFKSNSRFIRCSSFNLKKTLKERLISTD